MIFQNGVCSHIGLSEAPIALRGAVGRNSSLIWALGLLASAQSSTFTVTYAGQYVNEGFNGVSGDTPSINTYILSAQITCVPPRLHHPCVFSALQFARCANGGQSSSCPRHSSTMGKCDSIHDSANSCHSDAHYCQRQAIHGSEKMFYPRL